MRSERHRRAVNLADPGRGPRERGKVSRWVPLGVVLAGLVVGLWVARGPIASGASRLGDWTGDAASAWSSWSGTLQDLADAEPSPTTVPVDPVPLRESRSLLLVVGDGEGAALALVSIPPIDEPRLVMLPGLLLAVVPGYGEFTLIEALGFGGADLAALAVANQMGIRIDAVASVGAGEFEAVLGDPVVVDVPVALLIEESGGERRLIAEGLQRLAPDLVVQLLIRLGTGDQFDLLRRQEATWEALIVAVSEIPGLADRVAASADNPEAAADALRTLATVERPDVGTPPVDRVSIGIEDEAFVLAAGVTRAYVPDVLGHLLLVEGSRPRVEILNGNGVPGSTDAIVGDLVRAGFFVIKTGNADRFDYAVSRVIAQGSDAEQAAQRAAEVLGTGEVLLEGTAPSLVVDVSIIVGTDIPAGEG